MVIKREVKRNDIMPMAEYGSLRVPRRKEVSEIKRDRRICVGPDAIFHFECYETVFYQIHEMLWIEKGGEEQIEGELAAYNPLIPNGKELVATLMFEIEDPNRRHKVLSQLGGVQEKVFISFDNASKIFATYEEDVDRTTADGKASSVHFLHFNFTAAQIDQFKNPNVQKSIGISHENYGHIAMMSKNVCAVLAADFH